MSGPAGSAEKEHCQSCEVESCTDNLTSTALLSQRALTNLWTLSSSNKYFENCNTFEESKERRKPNNQVKSKFALRPERFYQEESRNQNNADKLSGGSNNKSFEVNQKFIKKCGCPTILIVDDQYINRFIIDQFCSKFEIPCVTAEDGQQAVEIIKHECTKSCCSGIELVLMDLNMPILDGIEATKQIVQFKEEFKITKELTIVAVTAFPSESEKEKCIKAGMKDYYIKPFTINNFKSLIS